MKSQKGLFPEFEALKPAFIRFIPQAGAPSVAISIKEMEARCHFRFSENFYVSDARLYKQLNRIIEKNKIGSAEKTLINDIQKSHDNVALIYLDDRCGYGLISTQEIKKGSFVGFYSGTISIKKNEGYDGDDYQLTANPFPEEMQTQYKTSAKEWGNLSRFMPDLPYTQQTFIDVLSVSFPNTDPEQLYNRLLKEDPDKVNDSITINQFNIPPELMKNIATANVYNAVYHYRGLRLSGFRALYDIPKDHLIGFIYGRKYWSAKSANPFLFSVWGSVIQRTCYRLNEMNFFHKSDNLRVKISNIEGLKKIIFDDKDFTLSNHSVVSNFSLREKLVEENILPDYYLPLTEKDQPSFIRYVRIIFNESPDLKSLELKTYWQNEQGHLNLRCLANNEAQCSSLLRFFKPVKDANIIKYKENFTLCIQAINEEAFLEKMYENTKKEALGILGYRS